MVENLLDSEDVRYMVEALKTLGYEINEERSENRIVIKGSGGVFPVAKSAEESNTMVKLFLGNAGTAMRPLTAAVAAAGGNARHVLTTLFAKSQHCCKFVQNFLTMVMNVFAFFFFFRKAHNLQYFLLLLVLSSGFIIFPSAIVQL